MTKKELFVAAHKMAKEIKSQYPNVNYNFQFSLCLAYLQEGEKMVELKGSEKQIKWAETIRAEVYPQVMAAIEEVDFTEKQLKKVEIIKSDMENDSAAYWIENFQLNGEKGLRKLFDYLNESIAGRRIAKAINTKNGY